MIEYIVLLSVLLLILGFIPFTRTREDKFQKARDSCSWLLPPPKFTDSPGKWELISFSGKYNLNGDGKLWCDWNWIDDRRGR